MIYFNKHINLMIYFNKSYDFYDLFLKTYVSILWMYQY